jgi:hypothetical protein
MNNRRKFLVTGGALAAAAILPDAKADQPHDNSIYIHGLVWNLQLPAPMNDWLIRLDAKTDIPIGSATGFATLSDDFHDNAGSHAVIRAAVLNGDHLVLTGSITESKTSSLVGQPIRIEGKLDGESVEGLTAIIGAFSFSGAGVATGQATGRRVQLPFAVIVPTP